MPILNGQFEVGFRLFAHKAPEVVVRSGFMQRIGIDRIVGKHAVETLPRLRIPAQALQDRTFQIQRRIVTAIVGDCLIEPLQSHAPALLLRIHPGQLRIGRRIIRIIPSRPIQCIVGSLALALYLKNQSQIIQRLDILRAGIILRQTPNRRPKILRSLVVFAPHPIVGAQHGIGPAVRGIPAEHLLKIINRIDERVVELQVPKPHEKTLLRVFDLMRQQRRLNDLGQRRVRILADRRIGEHPVSILVLQDQCQFVICHPACHGNRINHRFGRRHCTAAGVKNFIPMAQFKGQFRIFFRSIGPHQNPVRRQAVQVQRSVAATGLHATHVPDTIPVMGEFLALVGETPIVIRLVVGVGPHHQLAIMARRISKNPGVPLGIGAPQPELATLDDVVIAD